MNRKYTIERYHTEQEIDVIKQTNAFDEEMIEWINSLAEWKWFLTLTFRFDVSKYQAEVAFKKWKAWIDRALFPNVKHGKQRHLKVFPFLERSKSGRYHFHVLIEDISNLKTKKCFTPSKQHLRDLFSQKWNKLNNSGNFFRDEKSGKDWLEEIINGDIKYLIDYGLKQENGLNNEVITPELISI